MERKAVGKYGDGTDGLMGQCEDDLSGPAARVESLTVQLDTDYRYDGTDGYVAK